MKKTIMIIALVGTVVCGCETNSSTTTNFVDVTLPEETTTAEITENTTMSEIEAVTPSINEENVISLFQSILLNEQTIRFTKDYGFNSGFDYGYFYLKDWREDYYAFSVVDFNHDGQNEICLYAGTSDGHGVDIISYEKGEAVLIGMPAYSMIMYNDGYLGYSAENEWARKNLDMYLLEEFYTTWHGYHNEMEISKNELEERKQYFSNTEAPKYELTKENIMQYVVLEAEPTNYFPGNVKPENVDCTELSAIQQVLLNQKEYIDENGKSMRVENLDKFYSDGKITGATFFTVWDMNKDGNDEVIVKLEGKEISHIIFTEKSGNVYGKEVSLEEFSAIFTDGTYNFTSDHLIVRGEIVNENSSYKGKVVSAYKMSGGGFVKGYIASDGVLGSDVGWFAYDKFMSDYSSEVVPAHVFTVENVVKVLGGK